MMKLRAIGVAALLCTMPLFAGNYNVDAEHTNVGFKVKHMMISYVKGEFGKFSGNFVYDEKTKILTALHGDVDVSSISTGIAKRDGHLKSADFFDVAKYPTMSYTLDKVVGDKAYGKLTIHGITKEVKMDIDMSNNVVKDPWGHYRTGLSLSGSINRKDFGLMWNQAIEAGGVMVGDEVKITVEIEGILQK
jgi:polyisoprenoid-binding protein YceI